MLTSYESLYLPRVSSGRERKRCVRIPLLSSDLPGNG